MSAGAFTTSRYVASYNNARIHPIRIQPETAAAATVGGTVTANTATTSAVTEVISATVTRGRRGRGLIPRMIRARYASGTLPAGYASNTQALIVSLTVTWDTLVTVSASITYLGATFTVVGKLPEITR